MLGEKEKVNAPISVWNKNYSLIWIKQEHLSGMFGQISTWVERLSISPRVFRQTTCEKTGSMQT